MISQPIARTNASRNFSGMDKAAFVPKERRFATAVLLGRRFQTAAPWLNRLIESGQCVI
jgi:hypothetical protein